MAGLFACWKQGNRQQPDDDAFKMSFRMLRCQEALLYERRVKLDLEFNVLKRRDWKAWVTQQLENKIHAVGQANAQELFQIFRPKQMVAKSSGKLIKPLPGLKDGDEQWKRGRMEIAFAWQAQFSRLENGEDVHIQELL